MRGFVGIGAYMPKAKVNMGTLIRSADCFDVSFAYSIGSRMNIRTASMKKERHFPLFHYSDFEIFRKSIPTNAVLVCVELSDNARNIHTFTPPERVVYLLGPEDGNIPSSILNHEQVKETLYIPTKHCLNIAVAGSIVLYHHFYRRGKC